VADVTQVDKLLHGDENVVCADDGYTGVEKRSEHAEPRSDLAGRSTMQHLQDADNRAQVQSQAQDEKAKAQSSD
jgi:IS5 family transposase